MANIKSAKKRILVNRTKAARNKAIKSAVKTSMKKVEAAVANKDSHHRHVAVFFVIIFCNCQNIRQLPFFLFYFTAVLNDQ